MDNWFKRNLTHIIVTALFLAICFLYFSPAFSGKTLGQNDVTRAQSTQTEINAYKDKGTTVLWTNQIHGGMPAFQIWAPYSANITTWVVKGINTIFPNPVGIVFILLMGTYFLFCVFRVNPWLAAAGAIAFTFSSYNIILLAAGHANQAFAIAFFAPVLASIILVLRGRYVLGPALTALFLSMEIKANHIQMTYYLLIAVLLLLCFELYNVLKNKTLPAFIKSILYLTAATILALAVNASILWSTYDYGKDTIRGKSNLTQNTKEPASGLPRDYAYQWSQGVGESLTFLIPNAYGGSSRGSVDKDSHVIKALTDMGADISQAQNFSQGRMPLYWGEKPFTEGSFYFGAVICFLFVLGLFVVKSSVKWWLLSVIILTELLSFGKNWPYLSDLFFNYVPLYNKFRAVESILAVAGLCFPILAILAANELIVNDNKAELLKKIKLSFYITAGICLVVAIIPSLFLSFKSSDHETFVSQVSQMLSIDAPKANSLANSLVEDRSDAAQSDAIRSLIFIALTFGIIWAFIKKKITVLTLSLAILGLILVDFWTIDKRYLNNGSFVSKRDVAKPELREVDAVILRDKDPDYRVIDLTKDILSDQVTPYFHKAIGGYSAVRLKRFNELVENQLTKSINPEVLNMLNTKYVIASDPVSQALVVKQNPTASGHAWFVKSIKYVPNADAEMLALSTFSAKQEAVVDRQYQSVINVKASPVSDTTDKIDLLSYSPDHLVYQYSASKPQIAVFSEIYYNRGWTMKIDGVEKPYFRADYVLRAAAVPAGNHAIEFNFHPVSYYAGEKISMAGSVLLVLVVIGAVYADRKKIS